MQQNSKEIIHRALQKLVLPGPESHKGQNGKLLIIGGSELFHAASRWSLEVAAKFVDMVFYSSIPSNNELVQQAKGEFWNGIVIDRDDMELYLQEADCVLIGPGMTRTEDTEKLTNKLLKKYSDKKWVIDAGALQMIDPRLITEQCIVTPHKQEFEKLVEKVEPVLVEERATTDPNDPAVLNVEIGSGNWQLHFGSLIGNTGWFLKSQMPEEELYKTFSEAIHGATIVQKSHVDTVANQHFYTQVEGGNGGMAKGGTGDVLAGLIAAIYCCNDVETAAVLGSYINKKAGDELYKEVGPNFSSTDLVNQIPKTLWSELQSNK